MKKLLTLLFIGLFFVACTDSSQKQTNAKASENVVLRVGTSADYPPFEFLNDKNEISGFDIDLLDAISAKSGIKFEVQNIQFDGLIPALVSGKIDAAVSGMSATEARRKSVDFSEPYFKTEHLFVSNKGAGFKNKDSLDGKRVGAQVGTLQESFAKQIAGVSFVPFESTPMLFASLKAGKIDALVTDSSLGYEFINKSNGELEAFYSEPDGSDGFAIAFVKDKFKPQIDKINAAIKEIKQSGEFDKIAKKYNLN